jgi:hypothetical protein
MIQPGNDRSHRTPLSLPVAAGILAVGLTRSKSGLKPPIHVCFQRRFRGQSRHYLLHCICPLMTQSRHLCSIDTPGSRP